METKNFVHYLVTRAGACLGALLGIPAGVVVQVVSSGYRIVKGVFVMAWEFLKAGGRIVKGVFKLDASEIGRGIEGVIEALKSFVAMVAEEAVAILKSPWTGAETGYSLGGLGAELGLTAVEAAFAVAEAKRQAAVDVISKSFSTYPGAVIPADSLNKSPAAP